LVVISIGWFLSIGTRYVYPALMPYFIEEFELSLTVSGLILTVLWGSYAIGNFPGGILGDRIGERNVLVISTAISTVTVLLISLSTTIVLLMLATVAFGLATALFGPTRFTIFTSIYSDRAGTAVGLTMAAGNVGNSVLPPLIVGIAAIYTWRMGFGILIPLFALATVGLWWKIPRSVNSTQNAVDSLSLDTVRRVVDGVRQDGVVLVLFIQIFSAFANQGFIGLFPVYLIQIKGFSPQTAALVFGLYFVASVVTQTLSGVSMDYFGPRTTIVTLLGLFFVSLLALPAVEGLVPILMLTMLLSVRSGVGVVNNTYIAEILPEDVKGSGLGLLRTGWILIAAMGPLVIGYFADQNLFNEGYMLLAGIIGVSVLFSLRLPVEHSETE
jgi:MFS family permease